MHGGRQGRAHLVRGGYSMHRTRRRMKRTWTEKERIIRAKGQMRYVEVEREEEGAGA